MSASTANNTIELKGGGRLPLPTPWRAEEFAFAGNSVQLEGGAVVAVYDESTRTGAMWSSRSQAFHDPGWTIIQPCQRDNFFNLILPRFVEVERALAIDVALGSETETRAR